MFCVSTKLVFKFIFAFYIMLYNTQTLYEEQSFALRDELVRKLILFNGRLLFYKPKPHYKKYLQNTLIVYIVANLCLT